LRTTAKAAPKFRRQRHNLIDALKRSLASEKRSAPPAKAKGKKPRKRVEGQREMLLPISGKRAAKEETKVPEPKKAERPARSPPGRKRRDRCAKPSRRRADDSGQIPGGFTTSATSAEMAWSMPFDEPVRLRGGAKLTTLQHAARLHYGAAGRRAQQERWQIAVENLINAAETGGGWLMFARIGVIRALNGDGLRR